MRFHSEKFKESKIHRSSSCRRPRRILREDNGRGGDPQQSLRVRKGPGAAYGALSTWPSDSLEPCLRGREGRWFYPIAHMYQFNLACRIRVKIDRRLVDRDIVSRRRVCARENPAVFFIDLKFQSSRYGRENRGQLMTSVTAPILDRRNYTVIISTTVNTHSPLPTDRRDNLDAIWMWSNTQINCTSLFDVLSFLKRWKRPIYWVSLVPTYLLRRFRNSCRLTRYRTTLLLSPFSRSVAPLPTRTE